MARSVNGVILTRGPFTLEAHRWPFCGNDIGDMEGGDWWATLPVEAGPAATAAPAAGSNIPEGLSSPAALAQRQKCPAEPGMRENAGQSSGCVSMIS